MTRADINAVKKHLGITKQELILLHTYIQYQKEFDKVSDAVEFVLEVIKELEKEPEIEEFDQELQVTDTISDAPEIDAFDSFMDAESGLDNGNWVDDLPDGKNAAIDSCIKEYHEVKDRKKKAIKISLRKNYLLKFCTKCSCLKQVHKRFDTNKCHNYYCREKSFITVDVEELNKQNLISDKEIKEYLMDEYNTDWMYK